MTMTTQHKTVLASASPPSTTLLPKGICTAPSTTQWANQIMISEIANPFSLMI